MMREYKILATVHVITIIFGDNVSMAHSVLISYLVPGVRNVIPP